MLWQDVHEVDSGMQNVHCEDMALDSGLVESNPCGGGRTDTICMNLALMGQLALCARSHRTICMSMTPGTDGIIRLCFLGAGRRIWFRKGPGGGMPGPMCPLGTHAERRSNRVQTSSRNNSWQRSHRGC